MKSLAWIALSLLCSCTTTEDRARAWLSSRGYIDVSVEADPGSTIGPQRCQGSEGMVRVTAHRLPVPEENPCLFVEERMGLCCMPYRSYCTVLWIDRSCER